jgi:4-hydroxy-tetrahydrodipicolinate reductase
MKHSINDKKTQQLIVNRLLKSTTKTKMLNMGILGVTGRVGTILTELASKAGHAIQGISSKTSHEELEKIVSSCDVLIDFSTPAATLKIAELASRYQVPFVSGTSGFLKTDFEKLKECAKFIPILHTSNFCVGIHLMAILLKKCEETLPDFDFSIVDKHHNRKKDSPSGTALFLAEQVKRKVQIASIRSGNIPGDHICDFIGENEMISISHRVFNRSVFAEGALKCAEWILDKSPKLYTVRDYLEDKRIVQNG